eukprot:gene13496-13621_t
MKSDAVVRGDAPTPKTCCQIPTTGAYAHTHTQGRLAGGGPPHVYRAVMCDFGKTRKECSHGESCLLAKNALEYWLHPDKYRTSLCGHGEACTRNICFFAHNDQELRMPELSSADPSAAMGTAGPAAVDRGGAASSWGSQQQPTATAGEPLESGGAPPWQLPPQDAVFGAPPSAAVPHAGRDLPGATASRRRSPLG